MRRLARVAIPMPLSSAEIARLGNDVTERSFLSARTLHEGYIGEVQKVVGQIVEGQINQATGRLTLRNLLRKLNYQPDPAKRGTIEDLSSDRRLNLVLEHNVREARSYGQYVQNQSDTALLMFPAQELVRVALRQVPRDWPARWRAAGGRLYEGRMIARKDDPIWTSISRFGHPWPPFDFNSGMGVRNVRRSEAIELGVIKRTDQVQPTRRAFNDEVADAA